MKTPSLTFANFSLAFGILYLFLFQLQPGNIDDKSFYFASSNLGFFSSDYFEKREVLKSKALEQCPDQRCQFRTGERLSGFAMYPLFSITEKFIFSLLTFEDNELHRISLTYNLTFLMLFLLGLVTLLCLTLKSSQPLVGFFILSSIALFSGLLNQIDCIESLLPTASDHKYGPAIYVPRGIQVLYFLVAVYTFFSKNILIFSLLTLLIALSHTPHGAFFLLILFAAVVAEDLSLKTLINKWKTLLWLSLLGLFCAGWTLTNYVSHAPSELGQQLDWLGYFQWKTLFRLIYLSPVLIFFTKSKEESSFRRLAGLSTILLVAGELLFFIKGAIPRDVQQSALVQLPSRIGAGIYPGLFFLTLYSLSTQFSSQVTKRMAQTLCLLMITLFTSFLLRKSQTNIALNLSSFKYGLEQHYQKKGYQPGDHHKVIMQNLSPEKEVLFNLFTFRYYQSAD